MSPGAITYLKHALKNGLGSLPELPGNHRSVSHDGAEYLIRALTADPTTINQVMSLDRADHHVPEVLELVTGKYEVQERLADPTLTNAALRTFDETRTAYEHVWNAIHACHEAGIGHGDVHTGNVLYHDGAIKIIDWKRARARDTPSRTARLDTAHYDYFGLVATGRMLFADHAEVHTLFPKHGGSNLNPENLERTISRISEALTLPRFA